MLKLRINPIVAKDLKSIRDYVIIYKVGDENVEIYRVLNRYQDITRIFD